MIRKFLAVCSTLGLSSVLLAGDYPSVSDYLAWPSDTPNGLTKFVGGNVTPDDFDDAFALHGTSLYLVHAPAMFARWELLASGVTDFVVVPRGVNGIDGALFSDSSGLRLAKWQSGAASVAPIAGTSAWANAGQLCAVDDGFGGTSVAAVAAGNRVRRGKWAANGAWSNGVTTTETSAITSLALANYSPTAGTEQACVAGNTLRIRTETGTLLANTGVVNTVAHKVFRIADGGHALDSFLYVAASTLGAPYQEVLQEVFYDGASLTIETGIWLVRNAVTNHPWAKGERCVTIQAANYGEIFRFRDAGYTPNTTTFAIAQPGPQEETYWNITVTADQLDSAPAVTDGAMAVADFDADGRDDVFVASPGQRYGYFFPAAAIHNRYNQLRVEERLGYPGSGGSGLQGTIDLTAAVIIDAQPQGISGGPANGVAAVWWLRDGLGNTLNTTPYTKVVPATPGVAAVLPIVVNGQNPATTLVYVQFRAVRATFPQTSPAVVLERGAPLNCVTMDEQLDPLLCTLFDAEPDRWSPDNRVQNFCTSGTYGGAPILSGFNRRSSIGPFAGGAGSPPGGN